jgi:hypothetical protein
MQCIFHKLLQNDSNSHFCHFHIVSFKYATADIQAENQNVGRLDAAARQGINEALARLNPVDLGPQVGDRIHDDEDGVPE